MNWLLPGPLFTPCSLLHSGKERPGCSRSIWNAVGSVPRIGAQTGMECFSVEPPELETAGNVEAGSFPHVWQNQRLLLPSPHPVHCKHEAPESFEEGRKPEDVSKKVLDTHREGLACAFSRAAPASHVPDRGGPHVVKGDRRSCRLVNRLMQPRLPAWLAMQAVWLLGG